MSHEALSGQTYKSSFLPAPPGNRQCNSRTGLEWATLLHSQRALKRLRHPEFSVFTVPGGGGPLARHAVAFIRTTIAFATLTCLHEQRASLAAHHISPNCCHHHSTTLRLLKPRFFTAAAFTCRSACPSPSSQRKRSSGKSTIASFNASNPSARPHQPAHNHALTERFYAFTITYTTDQTFVVRTLIKKAKADRQPLYSCFVDFKKAYDTVPRDLLWENIDIDLHTGGGPIWPSLERKGKEGLPFYSH